MPKITKKNALIGAGAAVAAIAGAAAVYFTLIAPATTEEVVPATAIAAIGTIQSSVPAEGRIQVETWDLAFSTQGTVASVDVKPGDTVVAGQVLAALKGDKASSQVAQSAAALAGASAKLAGTLAGPSAADIAVKQVAVDAALANLSSAEAALALVSEANGATAIEIQAKEAAVINAQSAVRTAEANLAVAQEGATSSDIAAARAAVSQASAALDGARATAADNEIVAPISGTVIEVNIAVGALSSTNGGAAIVIADLEHPYIAATIDESDVAKATVGLPVDVMVDAVGGVVLVGEVLSVAPVGSIDPNGIVTFSVRTTVDLADSGSAPGMSVRLDIITQRAADVLTIPTGAVTMSGGKQYVQLVGSDGTTKNVPVTLGITDGAQVEVLSGLSAGDRVLLVASGS